jgi:hypothetical protein
MNTGRGEQENMSSLPSPRLFQIWDFHTSFARLLIRSNKRDDEQTIDVVFVGVFYIDAPSELDGLEITDPTPEELDRLESRTGVKIRERNLPCQFYVLKSGDARYYIGAVGYTVEENSLDPMVTSLRTRYGIPDD